MNTFGDDTVGDHAGIFGTTFSRGWAAQHLTDTAWLHALIRVELALLAGSERAGLTPPAQATEIRALWSALPIALDDIGAAAAAGGNPVIPLVKKLKAIVPPHLREHVHLGATSQDVLDTAMMLLAVQALDVIASDVARGADSCAALAEKYARTPIPGRTLMQDALPTTFGLKAAGWMAGLDGAVVRIRAVRSGLPVQYGGPVGTFSGSSASSGSSGQGPLIRGLLADELGLVDPARTWHTIRLPIADLAGALGAASGVAGKVALDIVLLAQTAVGEVAEGVAGRGGSSSMPHKRNAIAAISARGCSIRTPGLVGTLFAAMAQEHERAAGAWHAEWETLADLIRLTGSAAAWLADSLANLTVDNGAMERHAGERASSPPDIDEAAGLVRDLLQRSNFGEQR